VDQRKKGTAKRSRSRGSRHHHNNQSRRWPYWPGGESGRPHIYHHRTTQDRCPGSQM